MYKRQELHHSDVEYDVYFSAAELLQSLERHEDKYHVYIFDIEMPQMNGLELAKKIRERDAKALFVFLTGFSHYVMDVFDVITFDYIAKPINADKLESVLQKAISYLNLTRRDFVFQYRKNHFRVKGKVIFRPPVGCTNTPGLLPKGASIPISPPACKAKAAS